MILSLILILLVGVVAFWHYLQGFMSATISAILTAISVLTAFTLYEPLVNAMSPGKFADSAHAMMLVVVFSVTYLVLRIIFDKLLPGNIRVPVTIDKIGAGLMGLVAGCLAVGLLAVAAQAMPFGPTIGGYGRYAIAAEDTELAIPVAENLNKDRKIHDQMIAKPFDQNPAPEKLLLPVDDMVIGFVTMSSDGGSTAGGQPFTKIHPDYLQELFGNRIGIEQGAKRTAPKVQGNDTVSVLGVYAIPVDAKKQPAVTQVDGELSKIRREVLEPIVLQDRQTLLVVRILFSIDATDEDKIVRVSPGSVRLVAPFEGGYRQYFPVGTLDGAKTLFRHMPDDFLFTGADKAIDFVFLLDDSLPAAPGSENKIDADAGVFVEAKRYGRVDLGGKSVDPIAEAAKTQDKVQVFRKIMLTKQVPVDSASAKQRLQGSWMHEIPNTDPVKYTYAGDKVTRVMKIGGQDATNEGTWKVLKATAEAIDIEETIGGKAAQATIVFAENNVVRREGQNVAPFRKQ